MTHPTRRYRFAQALAGAALCSALLSVGTAHGALNAGVDVLPDTGRVIPAADGLDKSVFVNLRNTANTAKAATQPVPEPTEYVFLAGGLLILWVSLRWKECARRSGKAPRSRLKR